MFRLILTIDGHIIGDYTLQDGDVLTFGRSADNDIVISDEVVSFYQAYIVRLGDDLVLWDRGGNSSPSRMHMSELTTLLPPPPPTRKTSFPRGAGKSVRLRIVSAHSSIERTRVTPV